MSRLALKLDPVCGSDIDLTVLEAIQIARQIGLAYVHFKANGCDFTCYPDNRAMKLTDGEPGRHEYDGRGQQSYPLRWRFIPPVAMTGDEAEAAGKEEYKRVTEEE